MEFHKLSNCDYFIYTPETSIDVSKGPNTYGDGQDVYINGRALNNPVRSSENTFNNTVYIHFSPNTHRLSHNNNDSVRVQGTGDDPDHAYFHQFRELISRTGYEPELSSTAKSQKNIENTSYELLRVNPKLTGNIKVVVDSDSNLYLDTFKVSVALSQQKYRKIKLNPNEYYGRTLMSKLGGMSSDDLYKIEDNCYELFATCNTLDEQYYDTYNSGVRTNNDHLYSENFSILAPLCVKKILPDFFIIFKVKDYANIPTNSERIKYFLSNGEIVKIFDLRENSNVGKYIRNIYKHSKDFVGDIYTAYNYNEYNIFNGISLERGIVSNIYESASLERNLKNQTAMNDWYTLGFQRNRLVSKNIVNFEFMFNDTSEKMFSLNTYFGLYVKMNGEDEDFTLIDIDPETHDVTYDSSIMLNAAFDPSHELNKSVIYGITTPDTFIRMKHNICSSTAAETVQQYERKPYKCLCTSDCIKPDNSTFDFLPYVSFTLNKPLIPGEHFRIINKENHTISQVLCSNYIDNNNEMSDVRISNEVIDGSTYDIYTLSIYNIQYDSQDDDKNLIKENVLLLKKAFSKILDSSPTISKCNLVNDNTLSIQIFSDMYTEGSFMMQKFISNCGYNNIPVGIEYDDRISFFGVDNIPTTEIRATDSSKDLYPYGFESLGTRVGTTVYFTNAVGYMFMQDDPTKKISSHKTVLYPYRDGNDIEFKVLGEGVMKYVSVNGVETIANRITMGYDPKYPYAIYIGNVYDFNKMYLYQNYPLNAGICSILSVKDFFTDVIDNQNRISINPNETIISETAGEYQSSFNVAETAIANGIEESICDYIDKNETNKPSGYINDNNKLSEYLTAITNNNHIKSDISLISPYCCKWQAVGTDSVGKRIRVMFPYSYNDTLNSALISSHSYFLVENDTEKFIGFLPNESNRLPYDARFDAYSDASNGFWLIHNSTVEYVDDYADVHLGWWNTNNSNLSIWDPNFSELCQKGYTTDVSFEVRIADDCDYDTVQITTAYACGLVDGAAKWYDVETHDISKEWKTIRNAFEYANEYLMDVGKFYIQYKDNTLHDKGVNSIHINIRNVSFHVHSDSDYEKYINGNLSRFNHFDYRDYILNGKGSIDDILYSDYSIKPKMSEVYSYGNDSIEFVSAGVKLRISSKSRSTIDISKYNGYSGILICMDGNNPDHNTPCEIIIDETTEQIAFIIYNGLPLNRMVYPGSNSNKCINKYYSIYHSSPVSDTIEGVEEGGSYYIGTPDDAGFYNDTVLIYGGDDDNENKKKGFIIQSSPIIDQKSFDKDNYIMLASNMLDSSYYNIIDNNIYIISEYLGDTKLYVDSSKIDDITTQKIKNQTYKHRYHNNCFIYTPETIEKESGVKYGDDAFTMGYIKSIINDYSLIIKTNHGTNDYSGKNAVLLDISIIDPIDFTRETNENNNLTSGKVHPSFAEPVTVDIINFDFNNSLISKDSSISCKGCNFNVSDISDIKQTWIRKYLSPGGKLIKTTGDYTYKTTSINLVKGINPIRNCWEQDMFRTFSNDDAYTVQNGIEASYEKNTFFASRGLCLKSTYDSSTLIDSITLSTWTNTEISISDHTIILNVTDSIIKKILSEDGYMDNWINIGTEDINKSKYIENSVLKYLEINNYTKFVLRCDYNTNTLGFKSAYDISGYDVVSNFENELVYTNNKYYMKIKNLDSHTYYASMEISTT